MCEKCNRRVQNLNMLLYIAFQNILDHINQFSLSTNHILIICKQRKLGKAYLFKDFYTLRNPKDIVEIKRKYRKKYDNYYQNNTIGTERCWKVELVVEDLYKSVTILGGILRDWVKNVL